MNSKSTKTEPTILAAIGMNIVEIAALVVISVNKDVIADRQTTTPHTGHPSKKFRALPSTFDKPET